MRNTARCRRDRILQATATCLAVLLSISGCASTRELAVDDHPTSKASPEAKASSGGSPEYRVVMGLAPRYTDDGKRGMAVDAVNSNGPADRAGMKAGDRIVSIGAKAVANVYDYMAATSDNHPGDVVPVIVLREGREITLQVTLSSAK